MNFIHQIRHLISWKTVFQYFFSVIRIPFFNIKCELPKIYIFNFLISKIKKEPIFERNPFFMFFAYRFSRT